MWIVLGWCGLLVFLQVVRWTTVRRWRKHPQDASSWVGRTHTSLQRLLWLLLASAGVTAGLLFLLGGLTGVFPSLLSVPFLPASATLAGPLIVHDWGGPFLGRIVGLVLVAISAAHVRPVWAALRWLLRPEALSCWLERTEVRGQRNTWDAHNWFIDWLSIELGVQVACTLVLAYYLLRIEYL